MDDQDEPEEESQSLFQESSLLSIKRGAVNKNKRKRHLQLSAESSPTLKNLGERD